MRTFVVALAAFIVCSMGGAASSAPIRSVDVTVVGRNVFTSSGATAVPLLVKRPFTVRPSTQELSIEYSGAWAAVLVVHQDSRRRRPVDPWMFGVLVQRPPVGCAAGAPASRACADTHGLRMAVNVPQSVSGRAGRYPAGRYVAYLLTSPGASVRATWSVSGWQGVMSTDGRVRVPAVWKETRTSGATSASLRGVGQQHFRRYGALFDTTWAATRPGTLEAAAWNLCVRRGTEPPPETAGEHCAQTDGLVGSVAPSNGVGQAPVGSESGQEQQFRSSGTSAEGIVDSLVAPGTYQVPYAVHVAGPDSHAGVSLLSWEYWY